MPKSFRRFRLFVADHKIPILRLFPYFVILVLAIILLSFSARANRARDTESALFLQCSTRMQTEMINALRTFNAIGQTGTDVSGVVMPSLRKSLGIIEALSGILSNVYGSDYIVVNSSLSNRLNDAFSDYLFAVKNNMSTSSSLSLLSECMQEIEKLLLNRFLSNGTLLPAS